jgi:hypothetical protein
MTLLEIALAFGLVAVGIVIGEYLTARRCRQARGLPFDPRCLR